MWVRSFSKVYPGVKAVDVWRCWADVNHWPAWDKGLEYCKMSEAFAVGSRFVLKPVGGPKVKIVLSEVVVNKTFTDWCQFFGARMYDAHDLEETPEGLRITNTITVTGVLGFLWVKLVAKNVVQSLPEQMDALVRFAGETYA